MENSITKLKNEKSSFSSVLEKYSRLQNERARSDNAYKDVRLSVNLLDRFVQGESFNQVVITLYPGNEGYTLALKIHNTLENETARIPYEEDELLNCIETQQLPPVLVELLEEAGADVFYDGCVFVEMKDLRSGSKQSWNVLLKPSPQTILADAQQICQEQGWGSEELIQLESILCMAMAEPLCLNPNPSVGELAMNRDSTSKQLQSTALRRNRRKWSEGRKRKQMETSQSSNNDFKLHDFLKKKSLLGRGIPPILQPQEDRNSLPSSSTPAVQLDVSDVLRLAKPLERPKETGDCSMIPCEEYLYETDRVNGRVYLVRLTILQRPAIEEFLGQLYVDRDFRDGKLTGGASCMFTLGSRIHVNRYIQQFTEIFTEEGRKSVKITHQVQGHPPRVMYTHSMREKERLREKEEKQQQLQQQLQQQQQQQPAIAQQLPVNKEATETQPTNATPVPIKTENHQTSGTITKTALLESLKSGQVSPAIASLVSNLLSNQQQQPQAIRPSTAAIGLNANVVMANGHHHQLQQQQQQQQQSLLRTPAAVRPSTTMTVASGPAGSGQNVQLVTQSISLQQVAQQPQLRPNSNVRPTALAALLTNSKVTTLPPNISPGKGKFIAIDGGANGSASGSGGNTILMGQVVRPVVTGVAAPVLPSYSQAIGQTTAGATIVRTIRPAVHPSTAGAVKRTTETVAVNGTGGTQRFSLTVPALSALLAGTPSADSPGANNVTASQNLPSLLERLQQQSSPSKPIVHALNNNHHQMHTIKPGLNMSNNNLNVQSINLTGVQGAVANLPTLQSIQVSIPGLAVPLSLSLAVSSNSGTPSNATVTTAGMMGNVRLTTAGSLGGTGQPISIPLSVLQQIPNASGASGVQLVGNVATKDGSQTQPLKVAVTTGAGVAQLSSGGQSSGSLLAQQQLQLALQRQMQMSVQQKMAAKQKSKPPHS